MFSKHHNVPVG